MSNILFFTKGDRTVASSRLRAWQIRDGVAPDAEVIHSIAYASSSFSLRRFQLLRRVWRQMKSPDVRVFFVQKSFFPWDIIILIWVARATLGKRVIFDLDDAEWVHSPRKTRALARMASAVFAGSHAIYEWARAHGANTFFIPTVIDIRDYSPRAHGDRIYTLGWIGEGRAHFRQGNFAILKPALSVLAAKNISFRLVVVGSERYEPLKQYFKDVPFEVVFVDEADWGRPDASSCLITDYQFDIGLMPLVDTEFNRAKCVFKAIEYMGSGIPVVASRVGEALFAVDDGKSGFLCSTEEEWAEALTKLLSDKDLCFKMGSAGRRIAEERYSLEAVIPQIKKELEKSLQNKH